MFLLTVDVCNNYTVLSEADRAQGQMVIHDSNYRCDRDDLVPGWYRFKGAAGYQMADKCVPLDHCGTLEPVWLSGAHPTTAEGVVIRRVCYHSNRSNSCCDLNYNIRIKNCGAFFVYELPRSSYCPARYCGNGIAGKFLGKFFNYIHSAAKASSYNEDLFRQHIFIVAEHFKMMVKLTELFWRKVYCRQ